MQDSICHSVSHIEWLALKQGRYAYRHDNILDGIVKCLQDFFATYNHSLPSEDDNINFVKAGSKCSSVPKSIIGILVFCTRLMIGNCPLILRIKIL